MDFDLSEEHRMIRDMARDFAREVIAPRSEQMEKTGEYPYDIMDRMADLGMMGIPYPEEYGGSGGDWVGMHLCIEEIARGDMTLAASLEVTSCIAGQELFVFGTEEQKKKWLVPIVKGTKMGAFGLTEPDAGSDAAAIRTTAVREAGGWVLNGTKQFITNIGFRNASVLLTAAVTGKRESGKNVISAFIVPRDTPGFRLGTRYDKIAWTASATHEVILEDCRIPEDFLLGDPSRGFSQHLAVLETGRISIAAMAVGAAQAWILRDHMRGALGWFGVTALGMALLGLAQQPITLHLPRLGLGPRLALMVLLSTGSWLLLAVAVVLVSMALMTLWHMRGNRNPWPADLKKPLISASVPLLGEKREPAAIRLKPLPLAGHAILAEDGASLRFVPGGKVILPGNRAGAVARVVKVTPFYMDETPVTNHQYVEFLNRNLSRITTARGVVRDEEEVWLFLGEVYAGYEPMVLRGGKFKISNAAYASYPVLRVTPAGAAAYAEFYNRQLPTYVQWLFALDNDGRAQRQLSANTSGGGRQIDLEGAVGHRGVGAVGGRQSQGLPVRALPGSLLQKPDGSRQTDVGGPVRKGKGSPADHRGLHPAGAGRDR